MGDTKIKKALGHLNPSDDSHWTADGLPRMDVIERMVGDKAITRKDITDINPEFCREWLIEQIAKIKADAEMETKDEQTKQVQETQAQTQVDEEEVLRDQILAVGQEVETLVAEEVEIGKKKDKLIQQLRQLQQVKDTQHSATADTVARMAFIRSQNKQRAKRHEKGHKIMSIIGKDGINPNSKIDQAMRRKTARGTRRPPPRTPNQ